MRSYKFKINGNEYNVDINSVEGNTANVTVNGATYEVEMDTPVSAPVAAAAVKDSSASPQNDNQVAAPAPASKPAGAGKAVTSPLPGVIIEVSVKEGQAVKAGQKVAVIEAMKMENEIQASADGTVTAVLVNKGDSVLEGAEIVKIA
ncbi:MAG: biotin/lipoyl-binding protein [Bacteroidales bacterium]|nr:biotin/lipoyl-binding protein [Bacteroidales bacterium]